MQAFVTRKRHRQQTPPVYEKDSTEVKLAILESLNPDFSQDILLDALLNANGDVQKAADGLRAPEAVPSPLKRHRSVGYQSSLASTFGDKTLSAKTTDIKSLTRRGKTLHLFGPEDVESHTPCSIVHNFLPPDLADELLRELVDEAPTFWKGEFQMFEKTVISPHTFCFYVEDEAAVREQKAEYYYNGMTVPDVRPLPPQMRKVAPLVQEVVNNEIERRIKDFYPDGQKLKYQSRGTWKPNAAFVNCYDGGAENVGYHTDELTYLGPRAVIGSLSLGVAREFRVRRIVPRENKDDNAEWDATADTQGQISIHLPHNSLLVMHAEMQEEWKHSIAPATSIDPHPIAKNKRLNVTYRYYKESMHPRYTPRCKCDVPVCLRCVMKKTENRGRYMWMCHTAFKPGEKGCGFFQWAEFDDDGEPIWRRDGSKG